jgi:hypothetical protein
MECDHGKYLREEYLFSFSAFKDYIVLEEYEQTKVIHGTRGLFGGDPDGDRSRSRRP